MLASGRGVVLDATFRARDLRLRQRAAGPSVSDAAEELLDRVRAEFEPVTELVAGEHVRIETAATSPERAVEAIRKALGADSPGLADV